jgi:hypothetical protein
VAEQGAGQGKAWIALRAALGVLASSVVVAQDQRGVRRVGLGPAVFVRLAVGVANRIGVAVSVCAGTACTPTTMLIRKAAQNDREVRERLAGLMQLSDDSTRASGVILATSAR